MVENANRSQTRADPAGDRSIQGMTRVVLWFRTHLLAIILLTGLVFVLFGAVAGSHQEFSWVPIVREIGIAMLIVAIATLTIESLRVKTFSDELQQAVARKLEEIEQTAADAIMRGPLPRSYYEHVKRLMMLKHSLRTNWEVRLTLSPIAAEFLELRLDQTFTVRNLGGLEQSHVLEFMETAEGEHADKARIRYVNARFEHSTTVDVDEIAPEGGTLGDRIERAIRLTRSISMRPGTTLAVADGTVAWVRQHDMFFITAVDPSTGIRCVIDHPDSIQVFFEFPEGPSDVYEPTVRTEHLGGGLKRSIWEYPFPIVPSAAIICNWSPEVSKSEESFKQHRQTNTEPMAT